MASSEVPIERCLSSYSYNFRNDLLRNKVAFITGGGSGICFTIAEIFMRHGCDVAIAGRKIDRLRLSAQTLSSATGRQCLPIQMDVRKPQEVMAGVERCLEKFERIDILINGAAGNFLCPLESMSFNAFKTVMEIDTQGTFNVSKVIYEKFFKNNGGGVIINITATLHYRGTTLQAHVGPAKAAIEALTRHQTMEWGPNGVRVLCVAPGPIGDTEGMNRLGGGVPHEFLLKSIPVRRMGTKTDIGEVCLFLVSDMAGFISGTTVIADGGNWMSSGNEEARLEMYRAVTSKM